MRPWWLRLTCWVLACLPAGPLCAQTAAGVFLPPQLPTIGRYDGTVLAKPQIVTEPYQQYSPLVVNLAVGADRFYNAGYYGGNAVVANVEAGLVWNKHEMLTGVQTYYTSDSSQTGQYDWHATAVGGVIAGLGPPTPEGSYYWSQLGIAPVADLCSGAIATSFNADGSFGISPRTLVDTYSHFFGGNWLESYSLGPGITITATRGPANVINSSWGTTPDSAGTSYETVAIDGLARAHPLTTFVAAAGNDGTAANTVCGPASGYNRISVGALGNDSNSTDFSAVASFSSRGPQDYSDPLRNVPAEQAKRATVDIVAPGQWLISAAYTGTTGSNTGGSDSYPGRTDMYYWGLGGTSFSTPIVSGGVALLNDASYALGLPLASRDSRVIRAVLLNSASKLPGWNNGQHMESGVMVTRQALDFTQGAGALDLNRAFDQYLNGTIAPGGKTGTISAVSQTGWDLGELRYSSSATAHSDYKITGLLKGDTTLDVTLTWFRDRSTDTSTYAAADLAFANLDLEVWDADFTILRAASESLYNNVEHLHYTLPQDGYYAIRVKYTGNVFDLQGTYEDESYGLAWNVTAVPEPGTLVLLACMLLGALALYVRPGLRAPCSQSSLR